MNLILFVLSTVGMTHIIVDGSIFEGLRSLIKNVAKKVRLEKLGSIVDCYLCAGTWCGFFMGYVWVSERPLEVFACGCAGGFLANLGASIVNLIEAKTIANFSQDE